MEISLAVSAQLLRKAFNIVLTTHIHPDGDALGSLLALYFYLVSTGKCIRLLLDDDIPASLAFLPGTEEIQKLPETPETADLLVVLDASDAERIGKVKHMVKAPILNIDHHISNTKYADYLYLDSAAAATGEIIMQLLELEKASITKEMATCLFTAIATDCGFFRYANTSPNALRYAADLVEYGAKPSKIAECLDTRPLAAIKVLPKILETLEIRELSATGQVAFLTVMPSLLQELNDDTEGLINYPRNIAGVEIAVLLKVVNDNVIRVSLRSKITDVSRVALTFGGGGHARAAGCTINGPVDLVKDQLISAIEKLSKNDGRSG
ncbi:MAG TPA: DHH family phosphoesterase [Methylomusa anaerophila]|uniref:Bifunctional oligoribonuclease and PAP phosphatase NrnA n=1 Tax=Methylomusa anaerophila TaxID=1930071 RepID=A0A348APY7_9FIRM|nr:DHH family phosphoesterase [Methylomusa anaerophila]BBB93135.1 bifunctional oligoribonuclease and PAP phosphatase NrnA [Methylomusa anaerophila]HML87032.1 DHH family phosphoesterase [Methylomusa anaerophila]